VLEALAEPGVLQRIEHLRGQSAGQEHAVPGALGQHQVAGDGAEHGAEHIHGAHRLRIAVQGAGGHVHRLQLARVDAGHLAHGAMDVDQAGAADQALVGDAAELLGQDLQDADLLRRSRREADMAAFGFQRIAAAVAQDQAADAEAGAGPITA
jgi:hypothetical protein